MTTDTPMKIIRLTAENVKRLKAVEITPDGSLQVIGGRNAQGKSSVLDAIWLTLGGGTAARETTRPIRDGEDRAEVTLDLGDMTVTRSWTKTGTKLTIKSADGAIYSSPQKRLDSLVGQLAFDPLAFVRLPAREQRDALLRLVDLPVDLDAIDTQRKSVYDQRTEVGRLGKAIGDATVDEALPPEETSASEIIAKIRAAEEHNRNVDAWRRHRLDASNSAAQVAQQIESLQAALARLNEDEIAAEEWLKTHSERDVSMLESDLAAVEDTNAKIRANNDAKARRDRQAQLRQQYEDLSGQITALDKEKSDALAAATFPVDGLGFDDSGVTFQGVPLSQASSAEQIRVSLAMGMALNSTLRVLMVRDGSLLDDESMAAIREQVAGQGYQLWIERVGSDDEGAVVIEDGAVA